MNAKRILAACAIALMAGGMTHASTNQVSASTETQLVAQIRALIQTEIGWHAKKIESLQREDESFRRDGVERDGPIARSGAEYANLATIRQTRAAFQRQLAEIRARNGGVPLLTTNLTQRSTDSRIEVIVVGRVVDEGLQTLDSPATIHDAIRASGGLYDPRILAGVVTLTRNAVTTNVANRDWNSIRLQNGDTIRVPWIGF